METRNKKKRGENPSLSLPPEKEMLAHRVQTKYSLVHLICIAILCLYICGLGLFVDPFILQSTWIVKFELFMPLESKKLIVSIICPIDELSSMMS